MKLQGENIQIRYSRIRSGKKIKRKKRSTNYEKSKEISQERRKQGNPKERKFSFKKNVGLENEKHNSYIKEEKEAYF